MVAKSSTEEPGFTILEPPRSVFRRKRFLLPFGVSAGIALVGVVALFASGTVALPFQRITVVSAMMASKSVYFQDPEVRRILMANGVDVRVTDSGGSREIARDRQDRVREYDFVMPSGQAAGELIRDRFGGRVFFPFASPLVLGAFKEYAQALEAEGVARAQADGLYYTLDLAAFVKLSLPDDGSRAKTWNQLEQPVDNRNQIVAQSPNPCDSYSGSAWMGLVAFAVNGSVPPTEQDASAVAAKIKPVFEIEGLHGSGIGTTFFHPDGRTTAPVGVMYEHQFMAYQLAEVAKKGRPDRERVLLYPDAHHRTEPWLIAFSPAGERVGELVRGHPDLRRRALELGFRLDNEESTALNELLRERGLPEPVLSRTEGFLPKPPELEKMIKEVGRCPEIRVPI
ncbi:hypothetical protein B0I31_113108 [Saccharothrix carnea]|uniref:Extracellular solute-binding protein n=1 Tax=Saccharothrix carnea TaxID=1280637 RepID=A0A2P8I1U0_SACCR|nr:hypothetical protein [Saccharothrix carnea]PSL52436.1 hypothetical protein B0I31_113108 [Saccharothrix carnea]